MWTKPFVGQMQRFRKLNLACSSAFLQGLYNTMPKNKTKIQDNKILTQSNQSLSVSLHCIRASDKLAHPNNSKNSVTGWTFVNPRRQPPPNLTRSWYGMPPHWPPLMPYSNIYTRKPWGAALPCHVELASGDSTWDL